MSARRILKDSETIDTYEKLLDECQAEIIRGDELRGLLAAGQRKLMQRVEEQKIVIDEQRIFIENLERKCEIKVAEAKQEAMLLRGRLAMKGNPRFP